MMRKFVTCNMLLLCWIIIYPNLCFGQRAAAQARRQVPAAQRNYQITIYYTPIQGGFSAAAGFDQSSTTALIINGHTYTYQSQFVSRVRVEGFGQLTAGGYLVYDGGFSFGAGPPTGNRGNALTAKSSCAADPAILQFHSSVRVLSAAVNTAFNNNQFSVDDTGGAVNGHHLDLYWGVDNPRNAGDTSEPAGTNYSGENGIPVVILH